MTSPRRPVATGGPLRRRQPFGPGAAAVKSRLVEAALRRLPRTAAGLLRLHDDLLFLRAFPDTAAVAGVAAAGLEIVASRLRRLPPAARARLDDSGVAGSTSRHTFPAAIARWLGRAFPHEAEIDWAAGPDEEALAAIVRACLTRAEEDGFDDPALSVREWLRLALPGGGRTALAWLVERAEASPATTRLFDAVYDTAPLPIAWRLARSQGSTTFAHLPGVAVHRSALRRAPSSVRARVAAPAGRIRLLAPPDARQVIDLARVALTARCREVFPTSHANPDEVWMADLGEGTALAVIGAAPAHRLSLETNYGYLLLANGTPIGYGGVTPLFHQANTGINIFEPFRGSEASFLWVEMLRAFHTLFGVGRFVVNPYQFGADNAEAIESGAFWFYYRLGFRPRSREGRALAAREAARRGRGRRSSPAMLRALARDDLHLTLSGFKTSTFFPEAYVSRCSRRVTEQMARLGTTPADAVARVTRTLGVGSRRAWPAAEREAFDQLAPVAGLLDLERWRPAEQQQLVALLRAKGHAQEREFVRRSQQVPRFWLDLRRVLRGGV